MAGMKLMEGGRTQARAAFLLCFAARHIARFGMPYIPASQRARFDPLIQALSAELQRDGCLEGNLNYVLSSLVVKAFAANRRYAEANKLMGVLSSVAAEFYRVDVAPYEDEKRAQHGEIDRTPPGNSAAP